MKYRKRAIDAFYYTYTHAFVQGLMQFPYLAFSGSEIWPELRNPIDLSV